MRKNVCITYHMSKENEVAETCITIPDGCSGSPMTCSLIRNTAGMSRKAVPASPQSSRF